MIPILGRLRRGHRVADGGVADGAIGVADGAIHHPSED